MLRLRCLVTLRLRCLVTLRLRCLFSVALRLRLRCFYGKNVWMIAFLFREYHVHLPVFGKDLRWPISKRQFRQKYWAHEKLNLVEFYGTSPGLGHFHFKVIWYQLMGTDERTDKCAHKNVGNEMPEGELDVCRTWPLYSGLWSKCGYSLAVSYCQAEYALAVLCC